MPINAASTPRLYIVSSTGDSAHQVSGYENLESEQDGAAERGAQGLERFRACSAVLACPPKEGEDEAAEDDHDSDNLEEQHHAVHERFERG
jgi:hypothetical protein